MDTAWTCPKCNAQVSPGFEACWQCGTSSDGTPDPNFQHADAYPPIYNEVPASAPKSHRFTLASLFVALTCLGVIFAVIGRGGGVLLFAALCLLAIPIVSIVLIVHAYGLLYHCWFTAVRRAQDARSNRRFQKSPKNMPTLEED